MKFSGLREWLGIALWAASPFMTSVFAVVLFATPVQIGAIGLPMPFFPLMAIYFWSMTRPVLMPTLVIFLIGLFQDLLTGGPVGLWPLTYLLAMAAMATQRTLFAGRGRMMLWAGFALSTLMASGIAWFIARIALGRFQSGADLGFALALSVLVWPLAAMGFAAIQRATNQARRLSVRSTMAGL